MSYNEGVQRLLHTFDIGASNLRARSIQWVGTVKACDARRLIQMGQAGDSRL